MEQGALHGLGDRKYLDLTYPQNRLWTSPKLNQCTDRSSTIMTYHRQQMLCARSAEQQSLGKKHVVGKMISDLGLGGHVRDALSQSPPQRSKSMMFIEHSLGSKHCAGCFGDSSSLRKALS